MMDKKSQTAMGFLMYKIKNFMPRNSKSQAAMEFLMTYGWALLVVVIAIAGLVFLGILNPDRFLPDNVELGPGLSVQTFFVNETHIKFIVNNGLGRLLTNFQINVTECNSGDGAISNPAKIAPGKVEFITLNCTGPVAGTKFKSKLIVSYTTISTGTSLSHETLGNMLVTVSGKASSGGGAGSSQINTVRVKLNSTTSNNYANEDLYCFATIDDPNGDSVYASYRWYLDGILYSSGTNSTLRPEDQESLIDQLPYTNTRAGETWICSIQGCNTTTCESDWRNSSALTIYTTPNFEPDTIDVLVNASSSMNTTGDLLYCYANITDQNNASIYANYTWYVNGVQNFTGVSELFTSGDYALISILDPKYTRIGDNWSCSVQGYDGIIYEPDINPSENITINGVQCPVWAYPMTDYCLLNYSLSAVDGVVYQVNGSLVINSLGEFVNNQGIDFTLEVNGILTMESGSSIDLDGASHATAPQPGGNIKITTGSFNFSSGATIYSRGGQLTSSTYGTTRLGGSGGIINITTILMISEGLINFDGGDHAGSSNYGNGGHAGALYLDVDQDLVISSTIYGRGGTADSNGCDSRASYWNGHTGNGGTFVFNQPGRSLTIVNMDLGRGETGRCNDAIYNQNSLIIVSDLTVASGSIADVEADITASNWVNVSGTMRMGDNLNTPLLDISGILTRSGDNACYLPSDAGTMNIDVTTLNVTSSGTIISRGGYLTCGVYGTWAVGGDGGTVNISVTNFIFNGTINVDGGDHAGSSNYGNGGNGGLVNLDLSQDLVLYGTIYGRGGTADSNGCDSRTSYWNGHTGNGGAFVFDQPSRSLTVANIDFGIGEVGRCNDGIYSSNSLINVVDLYIPSGIIADVEANITASNWVNVSGTLRMGDNLNTPLLEINGTLTRSGDNACYLPSDAGIMNIDVTTLNVISSGTISSIGGSLTCSVYGTWAVGGDGGTVNISVSNFIFNGTINVDGGDHVGTSNYGNGGNGGTVYMDLNQDVALYGAIYGRGGTADSNGCDTRSSYWNGHTGNGGTFIFNQPARSLTIADMDFGIGEIGRCNDAIYNQNSLINVVDLYVPSGNTADVGADVTASAWVNVSGELRMGDIINAPLLEISGILSRSGDDACYIPTDAGTMSIYVNTLNVTSTGTIISEGGYLTCNVYGASAVGGDGGVIYISVTDFIFDGTINMDGGDHVGTTNYGNGGNAGALFVNLNQDLVLSGIIYGRGGTADSNGCDFRTSYWNGHPGSGGDATILARNTVIDGNVIIDADTSAQCTDGVGGNFNATGTSQLNISSTISYSGDTIGSAILYYGDSYDLTGSTFTNSPTIIDLTP